jgi:hypothetical protein
MSSRVNEYTEVGGAMVDPLYRPDKPAAHQRMSATRTMAGTLCAFRSKMMGAEYSVLVAVSG